MKEEDLTKAIQLKELLDNERKLLQFEITRLWI